MPLPFILAGVAIAAAGYGVKKGIDALDADCEADEFIKKAESLKEEATKKAESAESDCRRAFMRLGKKKTPCFKPYGFKLFGSFPPIESQ